MTQPCFGPAQILLPAEQIPLDQWACVACDQFTSQPEYWDEVRSRTSGGPSTMDLILPDGPRTEEELAQAIDTAHSRMRTYLDTVLTRSVNGFVYLERTTSSGVRQGLVGQIDLEAYSQDLADAPAIRPSERVLESRMPERLALRRGAVLETSHAMLLADDEEQTVVEPIAACKDQLPLLYDGTLMQGGGSLKGWAVEDPALVQQICHAVAALGTQEHFDHCYPTVAGQTPFCLMVADGEHSISAAKAHWQQVKAGLTPEQQRSHPARFYLAELCNLHSPAICMEPIHRVLFGGNAASVILCLAEYMDYYGARIRAGQGTEKCRQQLDLVLPCRQVSIGLDRIWNTLTVATVDEFIRSYQSDHPGVQVDFIHGRETARRLATEGGVGFLLPSLDKLELFRCVVQGGVLPCKTFSLGHAVEKRYYNECRKLI